MQPNANITYLNHNKNKKGDSCVSAEAKRKNRNKSIRSSASLKFIII